MVEWLDENVWEEEYVVMKVDSEIMEQVVKGRQAGVWYNCINKREPKKDRSGSSNDLNKFWTGGRVPMFGSSVGWAKRKARVLPKS